MSHENSVHLVDSDESIGEALTLLLGTYGIAVSCYSDAESFVQRYQAGKVTEGCLLIADNLPGMNGLSSVKMLRELGFTLPIIVISSAIGEDFHKRAVCMGATDVLEKPLMDGFLLERLGKYFPHTGKPSETGSSNVTLPDGTCVTFRVMQPEDAALEQAFIAELSVESRHSRFFSNLKQPSDKMLEQFTHPHYPQSYAVIATVKNDGTEKQIGVARYILIDSSGTAEFAVVVADEWQGKGIATKLLHNLTTAAAIAGVRQLEGLVLHDNIAMRQLARNQGFSSALYAQDPAMLKISKPLAYSEAGSV